LSNQFKDKVDGLSEEHIKHICRFLDKPYVKGEYQKWHKFAAFKWWLKREMDKRDKKPPKKPFLGLN
jgi:hypothetical protein